MFLVSDLDRLCQVLGTADNAQRRTAPVFAPHHHESYNVMKQAAHTALTFSCQHMAY